MQRNAILALLLLCALCAGAQRKIKKKGHSKPEQYASATITPAETTPNGYNTVGSPLPVVRFVDSTGREYTNTTLKNDANLFIMMFNPTCEHCEDMTVAIGKNIKLFKKSKIVLVAAPNMQPYFSYFFNNTNCGAYPQIKVTLDSSSYIQYCFIYGSLPQVNVYSPDRRLIKIFTGIESIDSLKPYIQ